MPHESFGMLRMLGQNLFAESHTSLQTRSVPEHPGEKVRADEHVKADAWILVLLKPWVVIAVLAEYLAALVAPAVLSG